MGPMIYLGAHGIALAWRSEIILLGQFSPSTFMWASEIKLRSLGWCGKHLYLRSPLSRPSTLFYETESLTEPEPVSMTRMVVNSTLRSVCLYLPNYSDRHTLSSQLLCGFRDMNSGLCSNYFTHWAISTTPPFLF